MTETKTDVITVTFNGENTERVTGGIPASEFLAGVLSKNRLKKTILVWIDGELKDISTPLTHDCRIEAVLPGDNDTLEVLRHTAAHIMAQAVKELFQDVQVAIGPAIENGFYYDFDYQRPFTPEDLGKIEARMKEIVKRSQDISREDISLDDAKKRFEKLGEKYKLEILNELDNQGEEKVSIYGQGEFVDLCRGPHLPHTGYLKAFKLTGLAGAYWKGDENRTMLQRIYGTAFFDKKSLKEHLNRLEEAKKRDHRRLGRDLDLFSVHEEVGSGLILWHPKGGIIRKIIEDFWRNEHLRRDYDMLFTPHIARRDLWKTSGHLDFYSENMYLPMEIDKVSYQLRPMNCPFHIAIYNSRIRSYRELPMRWCELGTVYRYERTGTLHGLMRVRGFTQDDGHIFCRPDQLTKEIHEILDLTLYILRVFGFERYEIYLSTRPDKYVGSDENWERATDALRQALETQGLTYEIDPGEGVFYGPKIDIKIKDCLDRSWQCSTIQVDFNLPERFDVHYIGEDSRTHTPIMVHRALLGSLERFFGVLIEHYAGAFPLWLAPIQAIVLTVTDRQDQWAGAVAKKLRAAGVRTKADLRNEKLGKKIREAQLDKIPYMLIVGDQEIIDMTVSPRTRKGQQLTAMSVNDFIALVEKECLEVFNC
ncbi:MAG: threonine--tRNA ligase [Deltaproteobacteria bacterium]|nr:threonine--tRNA ligase [Deltaproteobacteria bacterium]MBW1931904.1 threonine--tRNA ligase [Deltaproteobacteria bacterium]MBW1938252.1 threonine--tRNA ligase [Deltaproteobacteria bacterium]MBW1964652.1 threonine--tRNA ligase [Deltaproteobacteria bacterium]MBW2349998.1 threonine--tRNA ligase [Deltaproteobacteria bacterium]